MQFPLPENRISNFAQCSSYLNSLTCQKCHSLTLQQVICQVCHENLCIRCINQPDDQIPQPQELITESIPIYRNIKYQPDLMYRGECPICQTVTLLSSTIPKLFHKLYVNVKFQCQNRIHGCSEENCYPDLRLHETKCNYNQLQCQTCQGVIFKKDWLAHISVCNPKNECVCGTTLRDSSEHNEQLCLKYQCETLKSQVFQQTNKISAFNSPQKKMDASNIINASPFSLQALLQQSAQIIQE